MSDIVKYLRTLSDAPDDKDLITISAVRAKKAADEIEKLRKAIQMALFEIDDAVEKSLRAELLLKAATGQIK